MRFILFTCLLFLLTQSCVFNNDANKNLSGTETLTHVEPEVIKILADTSLQKPIETPNISDTNLNTQRTFTFKGKDIDPWNVLVKLFPGKYYLLDNPQNLPLPYLLDPRYDSRRINSFITWTCPTDKFQAAKPYDETMGFQEGVITRLVNTFDYTDSKGDQFKYIAFQHLIFNKQNSITNNEVDDVQEYKRGLVFGLAKLAWINNEWHMQIFEPRIGLFGELPGCPVPKPILLGNNQYGFAIYETDLGVTGKDEGQPTTDDITVIAGVNGKYQVVLHMDSFNNKNGLGCSGYESTITVNKNDSKKVFKDIIIQTKGEYTEKDKYGEESSYYPAELNPFVSGKSYLTYVMEKRYTFNGSEYKESGKPKIEVSNVKEKTNDNKEDENQ